MYTVVKLDRLFAKTDSEVSKMFKLNKKSQNYRALPTSKTLLDMAAANPDLSTLVTALKLSRLSSALNSPGPFTVFAPNNAALAKIPQSTLNNLLTDKNALANVLKYHVVPGNILAADLQPVQTVNTLSGKEFTIRVMNGRATITDASGKTTNIVATDIKGSNGVIHVIDSVLMP